MYTSWNSPDFFNIESRTSNVPMQTEKADPLPFSNGLMETEKADPLPFTHNQWKLTVTCIGAHKTLSPLYVFLFTCIDR